MNEDEYDKFTIDLLNRLYEIIMPITKDPSIVACMGMCMFLEGFSSMYLEWDEVLESIQAHKVSYEMALDKRKEEKK